jgi:DedD protein
MRTVIEDEEELETSDTELTLGMKSLLGVFFGAVLVCGIFFGFGYSMGRGKMPPGGAAGESPAAKSTAPTVKTVVSDPSSTAAADDENDSSTVTNSQASNTTSANQAQPSQYEYIPGPDGPIRKPVGKSLPNPALKTVALTKPSAAVSKPVPPPAPTPVAAVVPKPALTPAPQAPAAADSASTTMVQIAAISRQEDADVLISALKKHGYSAAIRREPKDNLLHVQIGPFSRDEAKATRAKLLNDGYNAILK